MSLDIYLRCEHCENSFTSDHNATHNLAPMWTEAGCYEALYESDGKRARETLPTLKTAHQRMLAAPGKFKALNPANGWGDYGGALEFLGRWIDDVEKNPDFIIRVSR